MDELIQKVIDWADERGILEHSTPEKQFLKFMSELGEFCDELAKENFEAAKMELGDVIVTIILYFKLCQSNVDMSYGMNQIMELPLVICSLTGEVKALSSMWPSIRIRYLSSYIKSTPEECLQLAYDKISNRKTAMVNGVAVKENG